MGSGVTPVDQPCHVLRHGTKHVIRPVVCVHMDLEIRQYNMSRIMRSPVFGFPIKSDSNRAVQSQKRLEILDLGSRGIV